VLEESLVRIGHSCVVPGSEEVQQKAADYGHAEAGVSSGRLFVGAGFDEGVGVQLKEQPLLGPQLGVAEALPEPPGVLRGCPRLQQGGPLLVFYCLGNRDQQPWARRRMRSAVPRRGRSVRSG
jgi:hypothetical protein